MTINSCPRALFVYGTLKRGEINHVLLAPYVRSVETATIRGALYDVGEFPALVEGTGRVLGQIVRVDEAGLAHLLPVLDSLEGYRPGDEAHSMYLRRVADVTTASGAIEPAVVYFYNPDHPALPALSTLTHLESGEWCGDASTSESNIHAPELEEYRAWVRSFHTRDWEA